jgi:hypothetical protein
MRNFFVPMNKEALVPKMYLKTAMADRRKNTIAI